MIIMMIISQSVGKFAYLFYMNLCANVIKCHGLLENGSIFAIQISNFSPNLLKLTPLAKIAVHVYLQRQAKNIKKTIICRKVWFCFPGIQKNTAAISLIVFCRES